MTAIQYRALAMFSGGLDSILAVKIIEKQGIQVIPFCFESYFFSAKQAKISAQKNNLTLHTQWLGNEYLKIVRSPRYGYGKNLNPCIHCHAYMSEVLGKKLSEFSADFLITGEVLGQRPKSQSTSGLHSVDKVTPYADLIVRPLSQKLLKDTLPIREHWVEKEALYDIHGRGRQRQMELATKLGVAYYPSSGGGCLLTERGYCKKLADLMSHDMYSGVYIQYLGIGRHFRISSKVKLILGRDQYDNEMILNLCTEDDYLLRAQQLSGPLGLIQAIDTPTDEDFILCGQILLRYIRKASSIEPVQFFSKENAPHKAKIIMQQPQGFELKYMIT